MKKISLSAEGESASSGGEYFRTSLYNYQKVRAQARYQATASLSVSADFNLLNNQNPQPGIDYDYLAHQESLSVFWSPAGGKAFDFQGSYSRSDMRSDIGYLDPGTLQPQLSNIATIRMRPPRCFTSICRARLGSRRNSRPADPLSFHQGAAPRVITSRWLRLRCPSANM